MKVNVKNTKMVLKDMKEDFSCPIPFSKNDYIEFSKQYSGESFNDEEYQCKINSYIMESDICEKIIEHFYKNNLEYFTKYFPEFREHFCSEAFVGYVFDYAGNGVAMFSDYTNINSDICTLVEYAFFRECVLSLIYRDNDEQVASDIIDENLYDIEMDSYDCFTIDDIYDVVEKYSNKNVICD